MYMLARFSNLVASLMSTLTCPSTESGSMSLLETLLPLIVMDGRIQCRKISKNVELGYKMCPRLRELASRSQRESGSGIHAT